MSIEEDDEARRKREMSMFAAFASGGSFSFGGDEPPSTKRSENSKTTTLDDPNPSKSVFAEAANAVDNSGTFAAMSSSKNKAPSSNLAAAVAALTGEEETPLAPSPIVPPTPRFAPVNQKCIPMHSERVVLPRPLFFGPVLPPRVLREVRSIVGEIIEEAGVDRNSPDLTHFPPHVRNLIGVIDTFGFGLSPYPLEENIDESDPAFYTGNPNVYTYQPVWSDDVRADREEKLIRKRTRKEMATGEATGETLTPVPKPSEVKKDKSPPPPPIQDERNMFAAWARGDDGSAGSIGGKSVGSPTHVKDGVKDDDTIESIEALPPPQTPVLSPLMNDKNLFSQIARGELAASDAVLDASVRSLNSSSKSLSLNIGPPPSAEQSMFSMWARGESVSPQASISIDPPPMESAPSSEQAMFSKWALGSDSNITGKPDGSIVVSSTPKSVSSTASLGGGTFRNVVPISDDSDDDSVVGSEMKKKVGINEHLDAALASLAGEDEPRPSQNPMTSSESISAEDSRGLLAQLGQTTAGGRPLTNLEITEGCVPMFAYDDPALPVESDLGIYETKEDQVRSLEQRRAHEIVEKHTIPDVFGPISCPNPATGPDDNHSSYLRTVPSRHRSSNGSVAKSMPPVPHLETGSVKGEAGPEIDLPPVLRKGGAKSEVGKGARTSKQSTHPSGSQFGTSIRYGWWNVVDEDKDSSISLGASDSTNRNAAPNGTPLIKQMIDFSADSSLVNTQLEPKPSKLRAENLPLSKLHPATSVASCLPFLSDRPPGWRYLQIDTKSIGFPPLNGEIEPLFCSLAIYHVETLSPAASDASTSSVPAPNVQKCGRVTEVLHFDVVSNADIEAKCRGALWPYHDTPESAEKTQGTRCGVFPIPSNLNIANLYAIIIVQKVLSEESDINVYTNKVDKEDKDKYREKAEKAAERQGQFLMPFAFGVTPLLQVFGTDVPSNPTSRAVQIPLFQFTSDQSERQIIDHIMVMLYPRADHRSAGILGPAPLTNGGTAVLVMRYFGYLGLHSVVQNSSSLARHRLVDFTGELQIRRMATNEKPKTSQVRDQSRSDRDYIVDAWGSKFTSEPTVFSGRNIFPAKNGNSVNATGAVDTNGGKSTIETSEELSKSPLYAQELAAIPLQVTPNIERPLAGAVRTARNRFGMQSSDSEPYFHSAFCNELFCNPRLVHNCPKGNIVTKVELRQLEWNEALNSYIARLPKDGAHLHNQRRGPPLVHSAYTSCAPSSTSVYFLDEFKVKLPLLLFDPKNTQVRLVLLFSVYHVDIKPKKTWTERGVHALSKQFGKGSHEHDRTRDDKKKAKLDLLGCGFLPITSSSDAELRCLIDNGSHDVKLGFDARPVSQENDITNSNHDLILTAKVEANPNLEKIGESDEDSIFETDSAAIGTVEGKRPAYSSDDDFDGGSDSKPENSVSSFPMSDSTFKVSSVALNQMSLQIRIVVHSSVHPQNATLNEFLQRRPNLPVPLSIPELASDSPWRRGREAILKFINLEVSSALKRDISERDRKLLVSSIDVCRPSLCSSSSLATHSLRIVRQLLNVMVSGSGEPSLLWANPAFALPLRINAFATLIHFVHTASTFMSRYGLTQLDGRSKWNVTTFARIISLLFDEECAVVTKGDPCVEPIDTLIWEGQKLDRPKLVHRKSSAGGPRRRHVRSDSDSFVFPREALCEQPPPTNIQMMSPDPKNIFMNLGEAMQADPLASVKPKTVSNINTTETKSTSLFEEAASDWSDKDADSTSSFHSALASLEGDDGPFSSFGGLGRGRRKFMTLPTKVLATIQEDQTDDDGTSSIIPSSRPPKTKDDFNVNGMTSSANFDPELVRKEKSSVPIKTMRVPKKKSTTDLENVPEPSGNDNSSSTSKQMRIPKKVNLTEDEIFSAGSAFLDIIGSDFGAAAMKESSGEDQPNGLGNHKRTRSRCSIDWTLPDDLSFAPGSPMDMVSSSPSPIVKDSGDVDEQGKSKGEDLSKNLASDVSLIKPESENAKKLPSYLDRVLLISRKEHTSGRWFPYVYEVLIFQWVAILTEQRRSGDKRESNKESATTSNEYEFNTDQGPLKDAALRARGFAVSCAPVLLEIIKKSLGARLHHLLRQADEAKPDTSGTPPLIRLDGVILANLESLISMITDACIDSRNFDSREFQQTSIDVNDSIVRFLRDLFAFLDPECVHRLILVYFSRFVVKDGKHWQDRDSKIGLRCSWEICKLRLNAVTTFIRFPDFVRVNSPQMGNWNSWPLTSPASATASFFDQALELFFSLGLPGFVTNDGPNALAGMTFPLLKPHWLAELVVDVCLSGTEHAEQKIQQRASSLLHELFWAHSTQGKVAGNSSVAASMYISFLRKILNHVSYLSTLGAKTQLRKDLMPCVVFVLQFAPVGLLRSFWRKLCVAAQGKGASQKYGSVGATKDVPQNVANIPYEESQDPHIFDMFSLLNIVLATFEYDGCEETMDREDLADDDDLIGVWAKEYLPSIKRETYYSVHQRAPLGRKYQKEKASKANSGPSYSSTSSRKWHSHDGSLVVVNSSRLIVREMLAMVQPENHDSFVNSSAISFNEGVSGIGESLPRLNFSHADNVIFARAASSVYLHALTLRESDIVTTKTLTASVELIKIFGIEIFMDAVGETLQHWMRVVMVHCGARRAHVRVQALEFLALILRVTWDRFGSFFRIRMPLLAVQTEVMERIVAFATARYYAEQRRMKGPIQYLSNDSAEASLSMFWRTLDRLHNHSASKNIAFRSALTLLAEKMKKLFRAYIAAHALSIIKRVRSPLSPGGKNDAEDEENYEAASWHQSRRISVHRIVTNSAGYCKQFLGLHRPVPQKETVAQNEAVEDAFLDAADVFSPTELPSHRVAWLNKLAEFHSDRQKHAEEATCHFQIQLTFRHAARSHQVIWSSVPFLPWTDAAVHIDGEGPAGEPDEYYYDTDDFDDDFIDSIGDVQYGRQIEKTNTFRRIFYRVANSIRMRTGDWEISGNKHLFYGVTLGSEFGSFSPWMSLREMEERMIESAEAAGELFLKAGIAESSRAAWSLATNYYAVRYNYSKLAHAYRRLSMVVASQVPVIDTNEQALDFSHPIGRFYRVWFHGAAPDDLQGVEFVYRAPSTVKLHDFGKSVSEAMRSILPENTPIDLVLDDGKIEEASNWRAAPRRALGPTPLEPVKIKVTPLRALLRRAHQIRGTPEWFHEYTDRPFSAAGSAGPDHRLGFKQSRSEAPKQYFSHHRHGNHSRSYSSSIFGSSGSVNIRGTDGSSRLPDLSREDSGGSTSDCDLVGVDKFSFLQPIRKDRSRAFKDWIKAGDFAEKSLRVTQLQVERTFPSCVARQKVADRSVFKQSPLEAGVDAVCTWCSVLFRTAVATNGLFVIGLRSDQGIGNGAAKVVADCIHSSRVKDMGIALLKNHGYVAEEAEVEYGSLGFDYVKLPEEEIRILQVKLARGIVVFIEMLHLLISRNRDLLLVVVEARKGSVNGGGTYGAASSSSRPGSVREWSPAGRRNHVVSTSHHGRASSTPIPSSSSSVGNHKGPLVSLHSMPVTGSDQSQGNSASHHSHRRRNDSSGQSMTSGMTTDRTDLAIAVQSELQRSFISMCKTLYPNISRLLESETPRWLKQCGQDNYFSSYAYRQTPIPMANELCFFDSDDFGDDVDDDNDSFQMTASYVSSADPGLSGLMPHGTMASQDGSYSSRGSRHHARRMSSDSISFNHV